VAGSGPSNVALRAGRLPWRCIGGFRWRRESRRLAECLTQTCVR
jgi:hypothetical protein